MITRVFLSIVQKNTSYSKNHLVPRSIRYSTTSTTQQCNSLFRTAAVTKKYDIRLFSAVSCVEQQQTYNDDDDASPDYSHLYNTTYHPQASEPNYSELGSTTKLNLFTAINSAMQTAMQTDDTAIVFGEDVSFGGVFRCSQHLREEFGNDRVFNTPLSENGIVVRVMCIYACMLIGANLVSF